MSTRKRSGIPGTDPVRYIEELEAERDRLRDDYSRSEAAVRQAEAELTRLRESETRWADVVSELAFEVEGLSDIHAENDRLREEGSHLDQTHREQLAEAERRAQVNLEDANRGWSQRNALLAALREIDLIAFHMEYGPIRDIARAAIAGVEGES